MGDSETIIVAPTLDKYSAAVGSLAADELGTLGPPCARDFVFEGCSAVHRMIIDYGDLRRKVRAAK